MSDRADNGSVSVSKDSTGNIATATGHWGLARTSFPGYAVALGIFAISRAVLALGICLSPWLLDPFETRYSFEYSDAWWSYLLRWDSAWYLRIMQGGYEFAADRYFHLQQTPAFFPLYPMLSRVVARGLGVSDGAAMLIIANLAALLTIPALYSYVRRRRSEMASQLAVALFSFFPVSLYLSVGYAEALCILLTVGCFWLIAGERLLLASICCGLATAAKPTAIVLLAPLVYVLWPRERVDLRSVLRLVIGLILGCSGIVAYTVYLGVTFGAPFAFIASQAGWLKYSPWSFASVVSAFVDALPLGSTVFNSVKVDLWIYLGFVAIAILARKMFDPPELVYAVAFLLFVTVSKLYGGQGFPSMGRQLFMAFPIFIGAAQLLERRTSTSIAVLLTGAAGLFWYSALFAQWYWVE